MTFTLHPFSDPVSTPLRFDLLSGIKPDLPEKYEGPDNEALKQRAFSIKRTGRPEGILLIEPKYEGLADIGCYLSLEARAELPELAGILAGLLEPHLARHWPGRSHFLQVGHGNRAMISHLQAKGYLEKFSLEVLALSREEFQPSTVELTRRGFDPSLLDSYLSLWARGFERLRRRIGLTPYLWALEYPDHAFKELTPYIETGRFHAYWSGPDLVGLAWHEADYLETIVVDPDFQNQGFGRQILSDVLDRMFLDGGPESFTLDMVGANSEARHFYLTHRFKPQHGSSLLWPG